MVNYDFLSVYFYSVPNLRFLKFNQNYETLQLKNTLKIKSGKDQKQVEVENGIYNIYGTGGIIGHTNTFLYDKESVGIGRKGTIDKPVYFDQPFWTVDTLFYSEIYEGFIPKYIFYLFQTINWKKYNTSTGVPSLTSSSIENIEKSFPCYDEQLKVANFLTMIDMRIETQIKIIDDCISYRNAIVDYYFESLSGNWKKVKLSNILKEYSELHIKDDSIVHATLSKEGIFPKTDRYDRDFLVKDEDKKYKVTHLNDICYNPANLKFGVITRNTFGDCIISPIYITFKIKSGFIPKFVELLVTRKQFISKARKYEQGTVYERMSVNSSDLLSMYVLIPSFSIQQKIVNIINNIDNKIFNEQKLLNLYKLQKVYLLKNMFI